MSNERTTLNLGGKIKVDLPQLGLATGIAGWVAWYCWDAWHASSDVENMILILPVSGVAILLYIFVVAGCCERVNAAEAELALPTRTDRRTAIRIVGSMALLAGFVVGGPLIGFDIATFVFTLAMMAFLGERRISVLFIAPLLFTAAVIYSFGTLLATPLPVFFVWGHNS